MILFLRDGHRGHCPQRRVGRGGGGGGRREGCDAAAKAEALVAAVLAEVAGVGQAADAATGVEDETGLVAVGHIPAADAAVGERGQSGLDFGLGIGAPEGARQFGGGTRRPGLEGAGGWTGHESVALELLEVQDDVRLAVAGRCRRLIQYGFLTSHAERSHHSDSQPQHGPKEYKISILSHKLMF